MKFIEGGVCAAKGFKASGVHCGIRKNRTKKDLALIVSEVRGAAAGVYTQNLVQGAPIVVTKAHLEDGMARAIICNSGNANTCNADGVDIANEMCRLVEVATGIPANDVIVASTGVIGQPLSTEPVEKAMPQLVAELSDNGSIEAACAIMTTDTVSKEVAVEFELGGKICHLGGISKGSGMIHPNMATMLAFLTTDAAISSEMLTKALKADVKNSFNMLSVDGDTSTNDTLTIIANGLAGNAPITCENDDYAVFTEALAAVTHTLCRIMAKDGEGATKLIVCHAAGGKTEAIAKTVAKSVICSSLTKAAMFGADANWGRVLCAIGYAGADVDVTKIDVDFVSKAGTVAVCRNGAGVPFSEEIAKTVLLEDEITIEVGLNDGAFEATAWGCDLTYDYVKINGDYRT
ncbi:MAG: bifunctional glutamate N-acetyltransferase/amino-acid acetyltransferase ArgJ [Clostridia bacterium]|nr:bifunctional glutamate N-acetyltransferase/amino-acid acetyltransferase ArgJ [Clostridia bacterium]